MSDDQCKLGSDLKNKGAVKQYLLKHLAMLESVGAQRGFLDAFRAFIEGPASPDDEAIKRMTLNELQDFVFLPDTRLADLRRVAELRLPSLGASYSQKATRSQLQAKLMAEIESLRSHDVISKQGRDQAAESIKPRSIG